ncbi:unnamed protein product [Chironomus riparius]|uniref:G domain-containing protein n=1 Tax=Chironomus riparius TaxID=315576 RepID=A0A9N9WSX7_9DIPT|nr:unnamed protein product [Chironomus riparius]
MHLLLRNIRPFLVRNYHRKSVAALAAEINRDNVNSKYSEQLEKFKDRILFNSLLEVQKIKIRKLDEVTSSLVKRRLKQEDALGVVPLPVVLNQLCEEKPKEQDTEELDFKKQNKQVEFTVSSLPYSRFLKVQSSELKESQENEDKKVVPNNWLKDYELYDEAEDELQSEYGTPDPNFPVTNVACGGCGALLHCKDPSIPGYLPSEILTDLNKEELKTVHCQRCHFLSKYNTAISVSIKPEDYINIISSIKDQSALAIVMVDLLDFPCSIFPNLSNILGKTRPIFLVGNKVDLIPRDSQNYLDNVKQSLRSEALKMGFENKSIKHTALISAKTGYGVEELITKLHQIWKYKGNVYLIGCTNVGKSSLFNAFLRSDYCKSEATNLIQRATASPWPGTTLKMLKFPILRPSDFRVALRAQRLAGERSAKYLEDEYRRQEAKDRKSIKHATLIGHIGRTFEKIEEHSDPAAQSHTGGYAGKILTLNENEERYIQSKWCFDTPGVMHSDQILPQLTTDEILKVLPRHMIRARMFFMKPGMSLFIAGLARLDFIDVPKLTRAIVYSSLHLPVTICNTEDADDFYEKFLGSELLGVPITMNEERLSRWPKLEPLYDEIAIDGIDKHVSACDFVMSSAGWIGINLPKNTVGIFKPWIIGGKGVHVRKPSILLNGFNLRGHRIRDSPAYGIGDAYTFRKVFKKVNM